MDVAQSRDLAVPFDEAILQPSAGKAIGGIQSLPLATFESYLLFINPYFQAVYRATRLALDTGHGDVEKLRR